MSTTPLSIQIALLTLTLGLQTLTGVATEYGWRVSRWNTSLFLTVVEGLKFCVSSIGHIKERRANNQPTLFANLSWSLLWETRHYAVPSLLYMIGNNLAMAIYEYLPSHIVTMTANLKIVAVMLIAHRFLGQSFSPIQWASSAVILTGVSVIQYNPGKTSQSTTTASTIVATLLYGLVQAVISGTAGAYCEYLYKTIEKVKGTPEWQRSIHVQNLKLYFYGTVFNIFGACIKFMYLATSASSETGDNRPSFHWIQIVVLLCNISGGLVIGIIMKYMDNVVRNIISSLALVTVTLASALVLGNEMTSNFLVGSAIVIVGAQMYIWGRSSGPALPVTESGRKQRSTIRQTFQQYQKQFVAVCIFVGMCCISMFLTLHDPTPIHLVTHWNEARPGDKMMSFDTTSRHRSADAFCGGDSAIRQGLSDALCREWGNKTFSDTVVVPDKLVKQSPLKLDYERYVDLPQGLQDSHGYYVDDWIVTTTGFCGGNFENHQVTPYCCGPRGFLKSTWALDTRNPNKGWISIADFPGEPRQGMTCAAVNSELFCWGGFSYTPSRGDATVEELQRPKEDPYGFMDGHKLSYSRTLDDDGKYNGSHWKWSRLPDMPLPQSAAAGSCSDGKRIFVAGGADYDQKQFHTATDRYGEHENFGSNLVSFDLTTQKWTIHPKLPGTPRFCAAVVCMKNKVFVIGGFTGGHSSPGVASYLPIIDSWIFEYGESSPRWSRMHDGPVDAANIGMRSAIVLTVFVL